MRSTEVYRIIHSVVGPWCKESGFRRTKSGWLGYQEPFGGKYLTFWFQCNKWGWDPYAGSSFVVEFQFHESREMGQWSNRRLPEFLTPEELEHVRGRQNRIIGSFQTPPREHVDAFVAHARRHSEDPEALIEGFWAPWNLVEAPYRSTDDIWLRYRTDDDVREWALFVAGVLPRIVAEIAEAPARSDSG